MIDVVANPNWPNLVLRNGELGYTTNFSGIIYVGDGVRRIADLPDEFVFQSGKNIQTQINALNARVTALEGG